MSTADVNFQWVRPLTFASRCRLVELREVVPAEDVGPPMYFISHACGLHVMYNMAVYVQ